MGHKCQKCGESAPRLFGFCPECDFNMVYCKCGCNEVDYRK